MSGYGKKAEELFFEGYNCAQAVFCAFEDRTGMDRSSGARLSCSFGGGMGRLREVCGAVSGALMVLGACEGYDDPKDPEAKKAHYRTVQEFARRFRAEHGSIVCRELLQGCAVKPGAEPEPRSPDFYKKRPCPRLISDAADIAAAMLKEAEDNRKQKEEEE